MLNIAFLRASAMLKHVIGQCLFFLYFYLPIWYLSRFRWLGGLLVERRTSVSQIRGSIPGQVAAV